MQDVDTICSLKRPIKSSIHPRNLINSRITQYIRVIPLDMGLIMYKVTLNLDFMAGPPVAMLRPPWRSTPLPCPRKETMTYQAAFRLEHF
jgi:hypothetical protein